ncbi:MAG: CBS domain-containing protein [Candidatus Bipolaricaulota bacterium]|nr:CBS domain-containing protein [Candidatus Bipolaricaulota bacterium]
MKVRDIMTKDLTSCEKDVSVRELIFILDSAGIPNIPIVDEEEKVIGYISEKDLIKAALPGYFEMLHTASFIPDLNQISKKLAQIADDPVEKYMQHDAIVVTEDDDDLQAADLIIRKGTKSLPVVDNEGRLVGKVKRIDLLQHLL